MTMTRWLTMTLLTALLLPPVAAAQTFAAYHGWCELGAQKTTLSGLISTTTNQASYPSCTVQVNVHSGTAATIYSDAGVTPLANPFTANANGSIVFYADVSIHYDIIESGGVAPNLFPSTFTWFDVVLGGGSGGGGGSSFTGTANTIPKFNGPTSGVNSSIVDDTTQVTTPEPINVSNVVTTTNLTNSGVGTVLNGLVCQVGGQAQACAAGSQAGVIGICIANCGASGKPWIAQIGHASLTLDNVGVAGDYVCISSTVLANGTDCGTNPSAGQVVGQVNSFVSGSLYDVQINVGVPNPNTVLGTAIVNNPNAAQTITPIISTVSPLGLRCPTGAASSLAAFTVLDASGTNLLTQTCGGTLTVGNGVGAISAGAVYGGWCTVAYATSLVFNASTCKAFTVTLTGDVTSITLLNMPSSTYIDELSFRFIQDATGGRVVSGWPTNFKGVTARTVSGTASASSILQFATDGTNARFVKGVVNQL